MRQILRELPASSPVRNVDVRKLVVFGFFGRALNGSFGTIWMILAVSSLPVTPPVSAGVTALASACGSLVANGWGHRRVTAKGSRRVLTVSGWGWLAVSTVFAGGILFNVRPLLWQYVVCAFVTALMLPGFGSLTRMWWRTLGERGVISELSAKRGVAVEPSLSAASYLVGATLFAPAVVLSVWFIPLFGVVLFAVLRGLATLPEPSVGGGREGVGEGVVEVSASQQGCSVVRRWWLPSTYGFYHAARGVYTIAATALVASTPSLIGVAVAAPSAGNMLAGFLHAFTMKEGVRPEGRVLLGLVGQAVPTFFLLVFYASTFVYTVPLAVVAGVTVGVGVLIGVLKASVPAYVYLLGEERRPWDGLGLVSARLSQGMVWGGMVGFGVATAVGVWGRAEGATVLALLTISVCCLVACAAGVLLDPNVRSGKG